MNKEEIKAKAQKAMDDATAKVNELKAKGNSVDASVKSKYEASLQKLETQKANLDKKFSNLENSAEGKWEDVAKDFYAASDSFTDSVKEEWQNVKSMFS